MSAPLIVLSCALHDKMACEDECVCVEWSLICEPFSYSDQAEFESQLALVAFSVV